MNTNELKQYYIDLWNGRKPSGASHTKDDWDERAIDWVRELEEDEVRKKRSEARVGTTAEFLRSKGLLGPNDQVIDIGCGPGRFVTEFAKSAGWVTGTDISPNMCRFGLEYAHSQGLQNVDFVPCNFKEMDVDKAGWREKYDLVFSSITPAMSTYDSFRKAESMSKAWCFQSNFVKTEDPLAEEILKEIMSEDELMPERGMNGLIAMFNILCLEGCRPIVEYYRETGSEKVVVDDDLVKNVLKNSVAKKERKEEIKEAVKKGLLKRADAFGRVERNTEWVYGWILWDVRQKNN